MTPIFFRQLHLKYDTFFRYLQFFFTYVQTQFSTTITKCAMQQWIRVWILCCMHLLSHPRLCTIHAMSTYFSKMEKLNYIWFVPSITSCDSRFKPFFPDLIGLNIYLFNRHPTKILTILQTPYFTLHGVSTSIKLQCNYLLFTILLLI